MDLNTGPSRERPGPPKMRDDNFSYNSQGRNKTFDNTRPAGFGCSYDRGIDKSRHALIRQLGRFTPAAFTTPDGSRVKTYQLTDKGIQVHY